MAKRRWVVGCLHAGHYDPLSKKRRRQFLKDRITIPSLHKLPNDGDIIQGLAKPGKTAKEKYYDALVDIIRQMKPTNINFIAVASGFTGQHTREQLVKKLQGDKRIPTAIRAMIG